LNWIIFHSIGFFKKKLFSQKNLVFDLVDLVELVILLDWLNSFKGFMSNCDCLIPELWVIVMEYAAPTLCDFMAARFPRRFMFFSAALRGVGRYGDLSAQWALLSPGETVGSAVNLCSTVNNYEHDLYGALYTATFDSGFEGVFREEREEVLTRAFFGFPFPVGENQPAEPHEFADCELLLMREAEIDSQYLYVHKPTMTLTLVGSNLHTEHLGGIHQSTTTLFSALLQHCCIEDDF